MFSIKLVGIVLPIISATSSTPAWLPKVYPPEPITLFMATFPAIVKSAPVDISSAVPITEYGFPYSS